MAATVNKIYVGSLTNPTYLFENKLIQSINTTQNVALVGQDLRIDTMDVSVADSINNIRSVTHFRTSDSLEIMGQNGSIFAINVGKSTEASDISKLQYGTPVWYYNEETLVGKFYIDEVKRSGVNKYDIHCVSAIGLLDNKYSGGGFFQSSTFGEVLKIVLAEEVDGTGEPVISYEIDDDVKSLVVAGWLPHATKRENLYQLIFANGVNIIKNADGNPRFTFLYSTVDTADQIDDCLIYNTGSVDYEPTYSKISVTEHTYTYDEAANEETLYDNTEGVAVLQERVWFSNAPVYVDSIEASEGLSIVSKTVNGAVVSGNGKLTGIPYVHTTKTVDKENTQYIEKKELEVTDCTLVNLINSQNLLNRLFAYFCPEINIKTLKNSIVFTNEKCGSAYKLKDPFRGSAAGYLTDMSIFASSFNKADCTFVEDYVPAGQGGLYTKCIILDKASFAKDGGVFTVPAEVFTRETPSIKIVVIGGGTGGTSGSPGYNGDTYSGTTNADPYDIDTLRYGGEGGDGGEGGSGGKAGRVFIKEISYPQATYNYTIGDGGAGGEATGYRPDTFQELKNSYRNQYSSAEMPSDAEIRSLISEEEAGTTWTGEPNKGTDGTVTTFGTYKSTDIGSYIPTAGVYNPILNKFYALPGKTGITGGKGGNRRIEMEDGTEYWTPYGETFEYQGITYEGGIPGSVITEVEDLPEVTNLIYVFGGAGAGAAIGVSSSNIDMMNGEDAVPYMVTWEVRDSNG